MQYTIKRKGKFQNLTDKVKSKLEDIFLSVLLWFVNFSKSEKLSAWIQRYTEKKMQRLQQEIIRMKWDKVTLDKATVAIHEKTQ